MEIRLPIPKNWQDFEMLCQKLWLDIWNDPNTQRNGRQGQPQAGVDVFGKPVYRGYYAGVQCKDKNSQLGSQLTSAECDEECKKAQDFRPPIREFTIATTAPRDGGVQKYARSINEVRKYHFDLHIWSWDEIEEEIRCRPSLLEAYYPGFAIDHNLNKVNISCLIQRDQCHAFFSRPEMEKRIPSGLREYLVPLCYELSDNACRHGKATLCRITCEDRVITIEDNGAAFNPIEGLDPKKFTVKDHVGSYVFDAFRREYENTVQLHYVYAPSKTAHLNTLTLEFEKETTSFGLPPTEIQIDMSVVVGRDAARQLAASVPIADGVAEVVLDVQGLYNISALMEFIYYLLERLTPSMQLILYLPRLRLLMPLQSWFDDERLIVRFR